MYKTLQCSNKTNFAAAFKLTFDLIWFVHNGSAEKIARNLIQLTELQKKNRVFVALICIYYIFFHCSSLEFLLCGRDSA